MDMILTHRVDPAHPTIQAIAQRLSGELGAPTLATARVLIVSPSWTWIKADMGSGAYRVLDKIGASRLSITSASPLAKVAAGECLVVLHGADDAEFVILGDGLDLTAIPVAADMLDAGDARRASIAIREAAKGVLVGSLVHAIAQSYNARRALAAAP